MDKELHKEVMAKGLRQMNGAEAMLVVTILADELMQELEKDPKFIMKESVRGYCSGFAEGLVTLMLRISDKYNVGQSPEKDKAQERISKI